MPMAQPQAAQGQSAQGQGQQGGGQEEAMMQALQAADQALQQAAQIMGQVSPEAGKALMQLDEQFRQIIMSTLQKSQGGGGGQERPQASQPGQPETGGRPAQQAY